MAALTFDQFLRDEALSGPGGAYDTGPLRKDQNYYYDQYVSDVAAADAANAAAKEKAMHLSTFAEFMADPTLTGFEAPYDQTGGTGKPGIAYDTYVKGHQGVVDQANAAAAGWIEKLDIDGNNLGYLYNPTTGRYGLINNPYIPNMYGRPDSNGVVNFASGNDAVNTLVNRRNADYQGGDPISDFLSSYGPMLPIMFATAGIGAAGAGLGGAEAAGLAGDAYMPAALGTDGLGSVGAAGSGLAGDAYMPAQLGADGVTSSLSSLSNPVTPQVAGTSNVAPESFSNGFNPSDPSTWPNISTPNGTGYTPTPDVPTPNLSAPTTDVFGNPLPGQTYNLGNSGTGMTNLNTSLMGGNDPFGNWLKQQMSSPTSSLKSLTGSKSGITNPDGSINYGNLISSGADLLGAYNTYNRQNQLWDSGAASRDRFNAGMQPGFDLNSMPGYKGALDTSSDAFTRSLSAKQGNPAGTGSAQAETQKYLMGSLGLPAWRDYENLNQGVGWNQGSIGSANSAQNLTSAVGQAAGTLLPSNSSGTGSSIASQVGNLSQLNDYLKKLGVNTADMFTVA